MVEYQVLARRYRPKKFREVIGQDAIVKTLKNALIFNRLAHAYLFCGSRGTGKTTLARIFAKALNCEHLSADYEPCTTCSSCREIGSGISIDVLEIDGASHRGIDDIRAITESVGYAPSKGRFKIYIIDEVHMLTKEAFNALLKTIEEPPAKVKFFFATTEPHKLPATILSRCQRFNLRRIMLDSIIEKLRYIAKDLQIEVEEEAFVRVAEYAEGGLRDAESLFDQLIAFSDGKVLAETVHEVLGIMPRSWFFQLDHAFVHDDLQMAFTIADQVFIQGKDSSHFLSDLMQHFRKILLCKLRGSTAIGEIDSGYKLGIEKSQSMYTIEQCMAILDHIITAANTVKNTISPQIALEALLIRIFRERRRLPIETVVRRLSELEKEFDIIKEPELEKEIKPIKKQEQVKATEHQKVAIPIREMAPAIAAVTPDARLEILPILEKRKEVAAPVVESMAPSVSSLQEPLQNKSRYDTLMQFAAVELDGVLERRK